MDVKCGTNLNGVCWVPKGHKTGMKHGNPRVGFLTGLPRSRTLWFAKYFDGIDGVSGLHEATNNCKSRQEFYDRMSDGVINCDSGLFITDWRKRWVDARTVVIRRAIHEVVRSLLECGIPVNRGITELLEYQEHVMDSVSGLHVDYNDINRRLPEIHQHLTDVEFEPKYAQKMCDTNIQLDEISGDIDSYRLWVA